jgi:hypothetical protein
VYSSYLVLRIDLFDQLNEVMGSFICRCVSHLLPRFPSWRVMSEVECIINDRLTTAPLSLSGRRNQASRCDLGRQ